MRKAGILVLSSGFAAGVFMLGLIVTASASTRQIAAPAEGQSSAPITAGSITPTGTISVANTPARAIALRFGVSLTEVVQLHNQTWGYGDIYKLYQLAATAKVPTATLMVMRAAGQGWGEIARALNIEPGNGGDNLGGAVSGRIAPSGTMTATAQRPPAFDDRGRGPNKTDRNTTKDNPGRGNQKDRGRGNENNGKPGKKP